MNHVTVNHTDMYLCRATSLELLRSNALRRHENGESTTVHHHPAGVPCEDYEHDVYLIPQPEQS